MKEGELQQILLLAPELLGESLSLQLSNDSLNIEIIRDKKKLTQNPSLIIWSLENIDNITSIEITRLKARWRPSPLLVILPSNPNIDTSIALTFECDGILQDPDIDLLRDAISTLLSGGRIIRLTGLSNQKLSSKPTLLNTRTWLLNNSFKEIDLELFRLNELLIKPSHNFLILLAIKGRQRELKSAKSFLIWFWSPLSISLERKINKVNATKYATSITISEKNSKAVWKEIFSRIQDSINSGIDNATESLFAIEGLNKEKQIVLLRSLLHEINDLFIKLQTENLQDSNNYLDTWNSMQIHLRQMALRKLTGGYLRLLLNDNLIQVTDELISRTELTDIDEDLPKASPMLDSIISNKPLLVDGKLLPPDDPRALIKLEELISNWLIRTGEIISSEIINVCSQWPELRDYLLTPSLFSTRELERLRNTLNSQKRWQYNIQRPIHLYESKRKFYQLNNGKIQSILVNETRDVELRSLGWWQKQITLLIEARDALAPQLQSFLKHFGDVMVLILTNVLGRAIGLVGKGIMQGMGRTISR
ncbi:DUF3685 domain-containing protein [Prochlorococcus marinus]|uniref:DUF3685 domain-containing protein n=1 Tax=Prochlorococcus marinus TaxID=1219 RepID=UPI0022B42019|nr:DUF3685 domain-containing protein [Prochlorococcus marinus]